MEDGKGFCRAFQGWQWEVRITRLITAAASLRAVKNLLRERLGISVRAMALAFRKVKLQVGPRRLTLVQNEKNNCSDAGKENRRDFSEADTIDLASHIARLAELSFRMEADRRESLAAASGRLLTCISVLSIALLTALPVLMMSQLACLIAIEYAFVFLLALASFGFALVAQYRFKYREPLSPQMLANHVMTEKNAFREAEDTATQYAGILEEPYQSIRRLNDRLSKLLRVSTIILGISIALVLVFGMLDIALLVVIC